MGRKLSENPLIILVGFTASLIGIYSFFFKPQPSPYTAIQITASAPVIDSIDLPKRIVCDRRKYDVPIHFHDPDGDAHRISWQLIYSKQETTLYTDAKEFYIDSQEQIEGTTYVDFIQWYVPGDEVTIRVFIEDRTELTGFLDFGFKCSN